MAESSSVPKLLEKIDPARLRSLAQVERLIVANIDGLSSVEQIAKNTGLSAAEVVAGLSRLVAMGLVGTLLSRARPAAPAASMRSSGGYSNIGSYSRVGESAEKGSDPPPSSTSRQWPVEPSTSSGRARAAEPEPTTSSGKMRVIPAASQPSPAASPARTWPSEPATAVSNVVEPNVDLDPDHQKRITQLHAKLGKLDHYALLGVPRDATKKQIKSAYFEHTSKFHPDRFFRRRLGSLKFKMEAIFGQMTEAYDTLTSAERRAQYDEYLASRREVAGIEAEALRAELEAERSFPVSSMPPAPPSSRPVSVPPPSSSQALIPQPPTSQPSMSTLLQDAAAGASKARISVAPGSTSTPTLADQARRDMLAKRLMGSGRSVPAPPKVPQIVPPPRSSSEAMDSLKRRHEEKVSHAKGSQAKKYAQAGAEARARNDMVAAANSYRIAASFAPEDAELQAVAEETSRAADALLADTYRKTAEYEEKAEHWGEAAKSWAKVCRGRPNESKPHDHAASCVLKANGDLHEASNYAQRAVQLEPKNAAYRVTLANVYLAAGLLKNARRELDAAAQLAPNDPHIQTLLKRTQKAT